MYRRGGYGCQSVMRSRGESWRAEDTGTCIGQLVSSARSASRPRGRRLVCNTFFAEADEKYPRTFARVNDRRATRLARRGAPPRREARDGGGMSSDDAALGASPSRGERDYAGDATTWRTPRARGEDGTTRHRVSRRLGVGHRARRAVGVPSRVGRARCGGPARAGIDGACRARARPQRAQDVLGRLAATLRGDVVGVPAKPSTSSTLADDCPDPSSGSPREAARRRSP